MTRSGLRGFSFGVLIACAVIAFYYFQYQPKSTTVKAAPLTEAAITKYLDQHKLVAVSKTQFNQWQAQKNAKSQTAGKTSTPAKSDNKSSAPAKKTNDVHNTTINIKSGMLPSDIADQLLSNHIIKNKDSFDTYMHKNGLEKYIQLGKFKVNSSMSIPDIAKVITRNH